MGYKEMPLALRAPGLTATEKLVLAAIVEYAHAKHEYATYVRQSTIAEDLGISKETVNRAVKKLSTVGYVRREGEKWRAGGVMVVEIEAIKAALSARLGLPVVDEISTHIDETSTPGLTKYQTEIDESSTRIDEISTPYKGELNSKKQCREERNLNGRGGGVATEPASAPVENSRNDSEELPGQTNVLEEISNNTVGDPEEERARQLRALENRFSKEITAEENKQAA